MNLQQRAESLSKEMFLGGPVKVFEHFGRMQLIVLIRNGLMPTSRVLDVGCGCLRGGYWIIQFLDPGCYCGIEPNTEMLKAGIEKILEPGTVSKKKPRFDSNTAFDFTVFKEQFDFVFARSIWTHTSKARIENMLDAFLKVSHRESVFLTSFIPAGFHLERAGMLSPKNWFKQDLFYRRDYRGNGWIGKSHESDEAGTVAHRFDWIRMACEKRGLKARRLSKDNFGRHQVWVRIQCAS